ncbi:MFS transporter [[Eubacterium] cellulosolvens]
MLDRRHIIIFIGAALGPLGGNAVFTIIEELELSFGVNVAVATLSITFFMIPFAIFQLFSGPISDLYDRNKTVLIGFLSYALGSILCAISPNIELFLTSRVIQGLGFAWISPVSVAILGDITPREKRGYAMGWFGTAITTGIATGPLLGAFLADIWRWAFVIFFALSILIGAAFWIIFKDQKYDIVKGSFKEILPKLKFGISNSSVLFLSITGFLVFFSYIGVITFLTKALNQSPFFFEEVVSGFIIASSGISGIIASPIAGLAVDKFGRKKTAVVGLLISMSALFCLTISNSFFTFVLLFLVLGCGNAVIWAALTTLAVELLPSHARGTSSSLFNSFRFFGYALAPILLASIYGLYGIKLLYIIGGLIMLVGIMFVYWIKLRLPE